MAKRPFFIVFFISIFGVPVIGRFVPTIGQNQHFMVIYVTILVFFVVFNLYLSEIRPPLVATRAKLIKRHTGYRYDYDYFKLPDKSTIKLRTSSWKQISSETKVGDIVIIKYKGWLLKSIEKVNVDSSKTSSSSPQPAKHIPKPVIVKDKRWD